MAHNQKSITQISLLTVLWVRAEGKHIASVNGGISTEEYYQQNKNNENVSEEVKENSNPMKELDLQDVAQYDISVEKSGLYYLYLDYTSVGSTMSNYTVRR